MIKKGDTLIEVVLAVGIFSMVAIAIVAVMSSGLSGTQTALETTLAREEIDAQAEALRFIQSAYIADKDSGDTRYADLWNLITKNAIDTKEIHDGLQELLQYTPTNCDDIPNRAFIINARKFSDFTAFDLTNVDRNPKDYEDLKKGIIVVKEDNNKDKLIKATTYPRLIYGNNASNAASNANSLADDYGSTSLYRAEGIYVLAFKDAETTSIVESGSNTATSTAAYYDFHIRTCWYGSGSNRPSTISTIVRLYDPSTIKSSI